MRCEDSQLLLFEFAEAELSPADRELVDQHLQTCDECAALLQDIWEMSLKSANWKDFSAPAGNSQALFAKPERLPWLQLASAFSSILILLLVIFRVEITTGDQGLRVNLGGHQELAAYQQEIDNRFSQFEQRNQADLITAFAKISAQQASNNQFMLATFLEASRSERRDELGTLMAVWSADQQRQQQMTEDSLRFVLLNQARERRNIGNLSTILNNMTNQQESTL